MKERLQKILSSRGIASRRQAEKLIEEGRIMCNGTVCTLGDCADSKLDEILLDGRPLPSGKEKVYILLHKPRGYVTTLSDEKGRANVAELVADCGTRVYPVGRLDMDSEGLLLLTNDGDFANRLMHPRHEVTKVYLVSVSAYSAEALEKLKLPIVLDGCRIRPPEVKLIRSAGAQATIQIAIHEGRNRQVRRMCAIAGMRVHRLKRIAEGSLSLGKLPAGRWRYLSEAEVRTLVSTDGRK